MKKLLLGLATVFTLNATTNAQISLIGASVNDSTAKIDVVQWEAFDSLSVTVTPSFLDGYYFSSSAFDAYNANYYLTGLSGDSSGLYSFNSGTAEENLVDGSAYSNISEFDMSTGKMYNLIMETDENISIYEFNVNTNEDSLIGIINEPGVIGIVTDAIGFDSNNGIIYYVGYTNDSAIGLYAISVRDSVFSYTRTILNTTAPINNIFGVNYDNENDKLFALNDTYDTLFNFSGRYVIEINTVTGDIINRVDLAEFPYYVGGSSCFDQNTSTYLIAAIDTTNLLKMVAINTLTDTYVSGFIPSLVSEIVCDNSQFAKNKYASTSINQELASSLNVYPNPVTSVLRIEYTSSSPVLVQVSDSHGKQLITRNYNSTNKIDLNLESFAPGLYIVTLISGEETVSQKIMVM
ncbi:MAG: T9SS type A sorting domain-containing protein [Bacteroidetes bacterium]|nr:T9SS type A sorting domain-containing protein [Bacteroidota bacterium]